MTSYDCTLWSASMYRYQYLYLWIHLIAIFGTQCICKIWNRCSPNNISTHIYRSYLRPQSWSVCRLSWASSTLTRKVVWWSRCKERRRWHFTNYYTMNNSGQGIQDIQYLTRQHLHSVCHMIVRWYSHEHCLLGSCILMIVSFMDAQASPVLNICLSSQPLGQPTLFT